MHYTHIWPRYMCAFKYKFMPVTRVCSLVVNCVPIGKWKAFCWQARALEYSVLKRRLEESFRSIFEWKLFYQSFLYCAHAKIRKSWPNLTASCSQHRPLSSILFSGRHACTCLFRLGGSHSRSGCTISSRGVCARCGLLASLLVRTGSNATLPNIVWKVVFSRPNQGSGTMFSWMEF